MGDSRVGWLGELVLNNVEMELKHEQEHAQTHLQLMEEVTVWDSLLTLEVAKSRTAQVKLRLSMPSSYCLV